ncbi:MAG: PRK13768 family protein [Candidatus Hermodarchaeia archaeon]
MHTLYFVGTAGSGKSTLTHNFARWLRDAKLSVGTVNLDPGVLQLPYGPDIDVRDFISLQGIMEKYNLGPNGGLIASIDLISSHLETLQEEIKDLGVDFLLFDTPGQIELFAFRETGPLIVSSLGEESRMLIYLVDAALAKSPAGLISSLLLSASVLVRFNLPQLNVLSRSDLLSEVEMEQLTSWLDDSDQLIYTLQKSRNEMQIELSSELVNAINRIFAGLDVVPLSAVNMENLDLLFSHVSNTLIGGEGFEAFR